jgi:ubiquinone/menaquinone biosynthesis C-methylase UbiE
MQRTPTQLAAIDASRRTLFRRLLVDLGDPAGGLLVDVGASSGYFVEIAAAAGWKAVGLELGRHLARVARDKGRRVVVGNGESIPLRSATTSVVTLWDVLDQFDLPRTAVAEAARVLRPGGILWARVRNGAVHELMRSRTWLPPRLSVLPNNLFSPRCLGKVLADAGFEDIRIAAAATSRGDPYASTRGGGALLLRGAKAMWNGAAIVAARLSAGSLLISPSITVCARRAPTAAGRND